MGKIRINQGTLAPRPSRGRPPPRASQAPAGVLCCPGGELLGTCDYSNTMKEKWIFSSQSHYSHRSVSPWKHSTATRSRRLPCWTAQVWAFALDRPGHVPSPALLHDPRPCSRCPSSRLDRPGHVPSPAPLHDPGPCSRCPSPRPWLQPRGSFAETLLRRPTWPPLLCFTFSTRASPLSTLSRSCLICTDLNLFNLPCPC